MPDPDKPFLTRLRPTAEVLEYPHPGRQICRKWIGQTDEGVLVDVYIAAVRVAAEDEQRFAAAFGAELEELGQPTTPGYRDPRRLEAIDPRLVT